MIMTPCEKTGCTQGTGQPSANCWRRSLASTSKEKQQPRYSEKDRSLHLLIEVAACSVVNRLLITNRLNYDNLRYKRRTLAKLLRGITGTGD